jgi:hypothetical protein
VRHRDRLDLLTEKAARRVIRLRLLVEEHTPQAPWAWRQEHERAVAYAVIEAANLWMTFARSHYISTALRARLRPAERVKLTFAQPIRTATDAITVAVLLIDVQKAGLPGPWAPRDEPAWQDPGVWRRLIDHLGASNLPAVDRAVGYRPKTLRSLVRVRNYFAHKSERSAKSVRKLAREYGIPRELHPMLFLLQPAPGFRQPVLLQWLDDLALTLWLSDPFFVA